MKPVYITLNTIITAASSLTAAGVLLGVILKVHKWYLEQKEQRKDVADLRKKHNDDVHRLKEENCLICYALSACLDGLQQLGANHTVPLAKDKLDKYLNQQAHE